MEQLDRLQSLVGKNNLDKLKTKKVLIIGLGGVGGYAVESLVRSGIENITIVDNDIIDISNINRQIIALYSTLNLFKVDEFAKRIKDINPKCNVTKINTFVTEKNIAEIITSDIDYVIDACDTISTKKAIIEICLSKNINFISCMGTGNKMDPTKFKIMDIRKTNYDPIARIIRKMVKDKCINDKVMVVCSDEPPKKNNDNVIGSNSFVPAIAGLLLSSYIINDIVGEKSEKN